jgi:hypothetical protein
MGYNNRYSGFILALSYHYKGIILVELINIMALKVITIMKGVELGYKVTKGTE